MIVMVCCSMLVWFLCGFPHGESPMISCLATVNTETAVSPVAKSDLV